LVAPLNMENHHFKIFQVSQVTWVTFGQKCVTLLQSVQTISIATEYYKKCGPESIAIPQAVL